MTSPGYPENLFHEREVLRDANASLKKRLASAVALIEEQKVEIARLRAQWAARWDEANKEGE